MQDNTFSFTIAPAKEVGYFVQQSRARYCDPLGVEQGLIVFAGALPECCRFVQRQFVALQGKYILAEKTAAKKKV